MFLLSPPFPRATRIALAIVTAAGLSSTALAGLPAALPRPAHVVQDSSIAASQRDAMLLAARRYLAFWNTGDENHARLALSPEFVDRTLPPGRPQGVEGPLFASKNFRSAVPDLKAEAQEMLLVGDRVVVRLHFTGHYTGRFQGKAGNGQQVDFIATDIYRIADGRIAENWHIEDNLTLLRQLEVIKP